MPNYCHLCSREKHSGLCDMAELSDGTTVHVSRLDNPESELAKEIQSGRIKVVNRWKKDWIGLESNESS
jgi:hypothetical protein